MSHRVELAVRVKQRLLVLQKGLDGHISLGVGHHLLGKRHDFGLRNREQGLSRKHRNLKKRLGDLVHHGLELRVRTVWIFEISEIWDLAFRKRHHFALRKGGLFSFKNFRYFRLKERQHHSRLSKRQDVLWETSVRNGLSIKIGYRLWLDRGVNFILASILKRKKTIF